MKRLTVRHGGPDYFIDSVTKTGWKEAGILSHRLSNLGVVVFYCLPLGRAKNATTAPLKAMGREAEMLPWLREFYPRVSAARTYKCRGLGLVTGGLDIP